jgi:ketosteroid isomerase-like protein
MSEATRIVNRGYELIWRENRPEIALGRLDPGFEWVVPGHPEGDVRRGPEGVIEFFREWGESWEDLQVDWEVLDAGPGQAVAIIEMRGRGRGSGAPVGMRFGQLWTFSGKRATRMVQYLDVEEARRIAERPLESLVRKGIAAYQSGDFEAVVPYLAEDVVWQDDPEWPDGQTWHGREGVRAAFRERLETTSIAVEIEEVLEGEGRALALMRWTAEGQDSGAVGVLRPGVLFEFEGELVSRARFFIDRDRAREAFEQG